MDTSTPVNRRRETKLIEDQEDSPVDRMDQDSSLSPVERTDGHDGCGILMRTGVSDDLVTIHLTPLIVESSSMENRRLFITARDLTVAARDNGVIRRSRSMPDVLNGMEENQYLNAINCIV